MRTSSPTQNSIRYWLWPLLLVLLALILQIVFGTLIDHLLLTQNLRSNGLYELMVPADPNILSTIGNSIEFLGGLVGIAITVASILVQLSATRYSSRVMELFVEDRVNLWVFIFYLSVPLYGLWLSFLGKGFQASPTHILLFKLGTVGSVLILIPYFNYLFNFLRPESIISRIQSSVNFTNLSISLPAQRLETMRSNLISSVSQLSDVVLNSLLNSDMNLALLSISRIKGIATDYLEIKTKAPDTWFLVPQRAFLGLEEGKLQRLATDRTWVEMHCLKQYELIFVQSLNQFREVTAAVGHRTRDVGMSAIQQKDRATVQLVVLFFNTYLRHAINAGDIRTMFHTFYQYRRLAEGCLSPHWRELLRQIAFYFKYYGQESERKGVAFAMEIAAYDLRSLVERAYILYPASSEDLLDVFLEVDRHPEDREAEISQRGVRKNQAILASFFLHHGEVPLARRIYLDMAHESLDRIRSIHEELRQNTTEDYWEIQDRGSNFYFVPEVQRPSLALFFSWFETT